MAYASLAIEADHQRQRDLHATADDPCRRQRDAAASSGMRDVGTGVLRYLDCNNAELRVGVDGGDRRTLRLRRSREVISGSALIQ